ncbi:hypothetical protein NDU88_007800 [Pleurodeles waltl]|uniref:Uncharacterized protein n=1 Tax=Pleurodeles waltl TaxID=8319 RepID=A0AAV7STR9_PLEWA|nr:hypothetical protein NDU88_007800 [Pleurodeles waltl]
MCTGSPAAEEEGPLSLCSSLHLKTQICTCPTQPQEEARAWKCLHRFLLSCGTSHPSYHTQPAESYARGSISKSSELTNSARLASGNKP